MTLSDQIQQAIARAKQDWESTADNLPHVLCLLDEQGRVVRVNRAIESWHIGRVNEVNGLDIHDLLHSAGCETDCHLREQLLDALLRSRNGASVELEFADPVLGRALAIVLRPISAGSIPRPDGQARVAAIITDVTALHVARMALVKLNEGLEARVQERTQELEHSNRGLQNEIARRQSAEEALRQSRNELEILSQQLIQAQERERRRFAQELHDSVGQSLSAIKYSLEQAAELLRQERHTDARPLLNRTIGRVRQTITDIRGIAMDLRPPVLDDLGVASALEWLSREFGETYGHIEVQTAISASDADIPDRLITTIFRCAQELLNNVAKHSRASEVTVTLVRDANTVSLMVCDDGVGLPAVDSSGSFGRGHGIRNLRERTQMTGGRLTLSSEPGRGTRARLDWPLGMGDIKT